MTATRMRTCGWVAGAAIAAAGAWLAARTARELVVLALRPPAVARAAVQAAAHAAATPPPRRAELAEGICRLLGAPCGEARDADGPPAHRPRCADPDALPVRSSLGLVLVAAVLPDLPTRSLATLVRPTTGETFLVAAGQRIGGALFLGLAPYRDRAEAGANAFRLVALLCNEGAKEYVEPGAWSPSPPASSAAPRAAAPPGDVRAVGPDRYEIARRTLDGVLGDLAAHADDARFNLAVRDGRPAGIRVLAVRPGTFVAGLGIEGGDVVRAINGYEVDAPEKLLELHARLRETGRISLELERAGRTIRKEYAVTP